MEYREYLKRRTKGSSLRGHHVPQQARLTESGLNPRSGTVVVVEGYVHAQTRTFAGRGRLTAEAESGLPLCVSEARCLQEFPELGLSDDTAQQVRELNRKTFPEHFSEEE